MNSHLWVIQVGSYPTSIFKNNLFIVDYPELCLSISLLRCLAQDKQLPGTTGITGQIQLPLLPKRKTHGPKTANSRTIRRVLGPQKVLIPGIRIRTRHRDIRSIRILRKRNRHNLKSRGHITVPGAVESDVEGCAVCVEFTVKRRRVGLEVQGRWCGAFHAGSIVEGRVRLENELFADSEGCVDEDGGFPDGEAGWVAVPLLVRDGGVAHCDC